jgi:dienelactone hydrolase
VEHFSRISNFNIDRPPPAMKRSCVILSLVLFSIAIIGHKPAIFGKEVSFQSGAQRIKGYLATPGGTGPFPTVLFLHGGMGPIVGGNPPAVVEALANAGFVGFAPIRRNNLSMATHVQDTVAAINFVKRLNQVDNARLAITGFSRGGLLAFMASTRRQDLHAVVLMAPAHGRGILRRFLADAENVSAPTLILVAKNDTRQADHVSLSQQIHTSLRAAGKQTQLIVCPPYGQDGHHLFFEVRPSYWQDAERFLKNRLKAG